MIRKLLISTCFVLTFLSSNAQQADSLSLENVKEIALKYNREIQKAGLSLQEAQSRTWESISTGLPQIDAGVDYSYSVYNTGGPLASFKLPENASNFTAKATQLIFSGSYIVGIQTAKMFKELSKRNVTKTEFDVIEQVIKSCYIVLATERNVDILEQNLANINDLYKRTESLVKVGVIEETQLMQLSVQLMNLENSLTVAKNQLELVRNMLRIQLGINTNEPIKLKGNIELLAKNLDIKQFTEQSFDIQRNIDFQLLEGQAGIKEKQLKLAKMSYLPTIAGFYNYTEQLIDASFFSPKHIVGVQANIPIFSSGQRKAKVDQAKYQYQSIQLDKSQLQDNLAVQAVNIKNNLTTYHDQYLIQLKNVDVTKTVYQKYVSKFEQGMASSIDLTTTNNSYLSAEMNLVNSMLQMLQTKIDFERLYGTLN